MGYIISTINMKGGVGKTTLTVNLATCLVRDFDKKVLVVDLDAQINATLSLIPPPDFTDLRKANRTLKNLIEKEIKSDKSYDFSIRDVIKNNVCAVNGLDLLPGDLELYNDFEISEKLHYQSVREYQNSFEKMWNIFEHGLVSKILSPVLEEYDFIFLDCAPGYHLLTRSSIAASNFYLLPAKPEPLSVIGIQLLERRIKRFRKEYPEILSKLHLLGIVFTMSGGPAGKFYQQVIQRVTNDFGSENMFRTEIPMNVDISRAGDRFQPVVLSTPNSSGAKAFSILTKEFLQKIAISTGIAKPQSESTLADLD